MELYLIRHAQSQKKLRSCVAADACSILAIKGECVPHLKLGVPRRNCVGAFREVGTIGHQRTIERFGKKTDLGRRRTDIGEAPAVDDMVIEPVVAAEPITVLYSEKGWIRTAKGHLAGDAALKFKEGDRERLRIAAQSSDSLSVFASNGRFYTLGADRLQQAHRVLACVRHRRVASDRRQRAPQ